MGDPKFEQRGNVKMEARMASPGLCANGEERGPDKGEDKFLIIGLGKDRRQAFHDLESIWPSIEIIAPTEKRMVRPRRKSNKEPFWIERPLFMEYAAITLRDDWERLFAVKWISFVLGSDERPSVLRRHELGGMITKAKQRSWEGELVEVITGPLKGTIGTYERGHIRVSMFGGEVRAKVSPYDISLA